ncbi:MAG TPA: hypothetical protein VKA86_16130 [Candidatus Krumholzibacteria bacterium]|nr:hypothetical protein [Candidatus Krumholzibacteria bacterium]
MNRREAVQAYWKSNRRLIAVLLVIWFVVLVYALVMDRLDRKYGVGDDEGGRRRVSRPGPTCSSD